MPGKDGAPAERNSEHSLDAVAYSSWIRSLQKKLYANNNDAERQQTLINELFGVFKEASGKISLRSDQWQLCSALVLYQVQTGVTSGAETAQLAGAIKASIDIHLQATQDGAGQDHAAFLRHASLLLCWHAAYSGLSLAEEEMDVAEDSAAAAYDPLRTATGLVGGPVVESSGAYVAASLPRVPSRAAVQEDPAQLEVMEQILGEHAIRQALREAYSRIAYDLIHVSEAGVASWRDELLLIDVSLTEPSDLAAAAAIRAGAPEDRPVERAQGARQAPLLLPPPRPAQAAGRHGAAPLLLRLGLPRAERVREHDGRGERGRGERQEGLGGARAMGGPAGHCPAGRRQLEGEGVPALGDVAQAGRPPAGLCAVRPRHQRPRAAAQRHFRRAEQPADARVRRSRGQSTQRQAGRYGKEARRPGRAGHKGCGSRGPLGGLRFLPSEWWFCWPDSLRSPPSIADVRTHHSQAIQRDATPSEVLDVCIQSVRSLPGSGKLWAIYLRSLARLRRGASEIVQVFSKALAGEQCNRDSSSLAELLLGRCDAEKELALLAAAGEQGVPLESVSMVGDVTRFSEVFSTAESAMEIMAGQRKPDPEFRLERFVSGWCERCGPETALLADSIWDNLLTAQETNAKAWLSAIQYATRTGQAEKARSLFKRVAGKPGVENKESILEAWITFEHTWGTCADIEYAQRKVKTETEKAWAAYYRNYNSQAAATQQQQPVVAAPVAEPAQAQPSSSKRTADEALSEEPAREAPSERVEREDSAKKGRQGGDKGKSKDRENCSVLVANLPEGSTELDLRTLFRGCGGIVEISGPKVVRQGLAAAVVEFDDRSAIAAARTRDKKQVRGSEVEVHIGHHCTLYVTNFPAETTDEEIRERFGQYGDIFDVRWPSRKFASTRRFCYVELTSPDSAKAALVENGRKLSDLNTLLVALSDPDRKRRRTDAHANERELYITGLPSSAVESEVRELFEAHGVVEGFRMPLNTAGKSRGIAFVDFATALDAQKAVTHTNGATYRGKALKVTIADKASRAGQPTGGHGFRSRAVKIRGLPEDAQEGLIQQLIEQSVGLGAVKKVEWTPGPESNGQAIVELQDPPTAGKVVLAKDLVYAGTHQLTVSSLETRGAASAAPPKSSVAAASSAAATDLAPRVARGIGRGGRGGRGGIGFARPGRRVGRRWKQMMHQPQKGRQRRRKIRTHSAPCSSR